MIKVVLFDFGGVLTTIGHAGFIRAGMAEMYGVKPDELEMEPMHGELRRGHTNIQKFLEHFNTRHGHQRLIDEDMFRSNLFGEFQPSQPVYDLAARLRSAGIRTGILSNVFKINADHLAKQGAYDKMEPTILSYQTGYAKPDPEVYQYAINKCGVKPNEILFVDDQEKCIEPAQTSGMYTVLASSPGQIVHDVSAIIAQQNGLKV